MPVLTETRGPSGGLSTTNHGYGGVQSTTFWSPVPVLLRKALWSIYRAGTYRFTIGSINVFEGHLAGGAEYDLIDLGGVDPIALKAKPYRFRLRRLGPVGGELDGWYYVPARNAFVDEWYHAHNWSEATPYELLPLRLEVDVDTDDYARVGPPPTLESVINRTVNTWTVTADEDTYVAGIYLRYPGILGQYEVLCDGVLVGSTAGTRSTDWGSGTSEGGAWLRFFEPLLLEAGVTHQFRALLAENQGASFAPGLFRHVRYITAESYEADGLTIGEWEEAPGSVLAHELVVVAPEVVEAPARINETRGYFGATTGGTADDPRHAHPTQTTRVWATAPLRWGQLRWDLSVGHYELRVDGVLIGDVAEVTDAGFYDFLNDETLYIDLEAGVHELEVTRVLGSRWRWAEVSNENTWVDGWFYMHNWIEAGGNELVPIQLRTAQAADVVLPSVSRPPLLTLDTSARAVEEWTVTFAADTWLYGIVARKLTPGTRYALEVDDLVVAAHPGAAGASWTYRTWLPLTEPLLCQGGVEHTFRLHALDIATFDRVVRGPAGPWVGRDVTYDSAEAGVPAFDVVYEPLPPPPAANALEGEVVAGPIDVQLEKQANALEGEVVNPGASPPSLIFVEANALRVVGTAARGAFPGNPASFGPVVFESVNTAAQNTTGAAANLVLNKPAGVAVGDLLVFSVTVRNDCDIVPPAGLTTLFEGKHVGGTNVSTGWCGYRIIDGTEGATFTIGFANGVQSPLKKTGAVAHFSGNDPVTPIPGAAFSSRVGNGATIPTWDAVTAARDGSYLLGTSMSTGANNNVNPAGVTQLWTQGNTSGSGCGNRGWTAGNDQDAGVYGPYALAASVTDAWATALMAIQPEAAGSVDPINVTAGALEGEVVAGEVAPTFPVAVDAEALEGELVAGTARAPVFTEVLIAEAVPGDVDPPGYLIAGVLEGEVLAGSAVPPIGALAGALEGEVVAGTARPIILAAARALRVVVVAARATATPALVARVLVCELVAGAATPRDLRAGDDTPTYAVGPTGRHEAHGPTGRSRAVGPTGGTLVSHPTEGT